MLTPSQLQIRHNNDDPDVPCHVDQLVKSEIAPERGVRTMSESVPQFAPDEAFAAVFGFQAPLIEPELIDASAGTKQVLEASASPVGGTVKACGTVGPVEEFRANQTNKPLSTRGLAASDQEPGFGASAGELLSVSVVVATYNRLDGLRSLLVDLCTQDCDRGSFEVVIVDDESKIPVTLEVANQALATQPNGTLPFGLRLFRRTNGGPGVARDTGIREALGEIVVILDDDMHIDSGFLRAHIDRHRGGATVVLGNIQTPREGKLPLFERFHMGTIDKFVAAVGRGEPVVEGARLCTGNVSFRRSAYQFVGGFDTNLRRCEDRDLGIRFELAGENIVFGESAVSQHKSDHTDVATWRKRNRLYGELDTTIAAKHTSLPKVSPWAFLSELPRLATPVGLLSATFPALGKLGGSVAYRLAALLDRRAKTSLALRLAGLSYGLDYYAGVGEAFHSPRGSIVMLRSYWSHRQIVQADQR
jgi:glycosyltransferase involved in cell wall biosynthesis